MSLDEMTNLESSSTLSSSSYQEQDDYIQRSIYNAIIQNDVEGLSKILNDHVNFDINQPLRRANEEEIESDGDDKNALMIACSLDCVDIVRYLLSRTNVNIDLQGDYHNTYLMILSIFFYKPFFLYFTSCL